MLNGLIRVLIQTVKLNTKLYNILNYENNQMRIFTKII